MTTTKPDTVAAESEAMARAVMARIEADGCVHLSSLVQVIADGLRRSADVDERYPWWRMDAATGEIVRADGCVHQSSLAEVIADGLRRSADVDAGIFEVTGKDGEPFIRLDASGRSMINARFLTDSAAVVQAAAALDQMATGGVVEPGPAKAGLVGETLGESIAPRETWDFAAAVSGSPLAKAYGVTLHSDGRYVQPEVILQGAGAASVPELLPEAWREQVQEAAEPTVELHDYGTAFRTRVPVWR